MGNVWLTTKLATHNVNVAIPMARPRIFVGKISERIKAKRYNMMNYLVARRILSVRRRLLEGS